MVHSATMLSPSASDIILPPCPPDASPEKPYMLVSTGNGWQAVPMEVRTLSARLPGRHGVLQCVAASAAASRAGDPGIQPPVGDLHALSGAPGRVLEE